MLHVVSGDAVASLIAASGILQPLPEIAAEFRDPDTVVPWLDVLSEGPVPGDLSPINLAHARCQYIAAQGWEAYIIARQAFARRDAVVATTKRQDEVIYWFDDDLTDVLQLVQALDRLAARRPEGTAFSWILRPIHDDAGEMGGLGGLSAGQTAATLPERVPVPDLAWAEARSVWRAFVGADPAGLVAAAGTVTDAIPPLRDGLARLFREYPDRRSGLSASEWALLDALADGGATPAEAFARVQHDDARPFLGDRQVWSRLHAFVTAEQPLLRPAGGEWISPVVDLLSPDEPDMAGFLAQSLTLTDTGRAVLAGDRDWLDLGGAGRWLGGVEFRDAASAWRYDPDRATVVPPVGA